MEPLSPHTVSPVPCYDFMSDIETGGTDRDHAPIFQIACVAFDYATGYINPNTFCMNLEMAPHRYWDEDTRNWWAKQDPEVFNRVTEYPQPPAHVLRCFADWVRDTSGALEKPRLWAKPISFEFPFFESYFKQFGVEMPFHFRDAIDMQSFIRGLRHNPGAKAFDYEVPMVGHAHHALDDSFHQLAVILTAKQRFTSHGHEHDQRP